MPEENATIEKDASLNLLTPEGLIMMLLAFIVDSSEFFIEFIPVIGQFISVLIDILAIIFIGGWTWFHSGSVKVTGKAARRMGKAAKWAKRMKWLRPLLFILEFIPVVGSLPLWMLVVYLELKNQ